MRRCPVAETFRLPSGGYIDRNQTRHFTFNGKSYKGFEGDTLASALLANGVHLVGRSFKYHRPRGIMSAGVEEANALVQLGQGAFAEPNVRATQVEVFEGLDAASLNAWPNLEFDLGAITGLFGRLFPAGFYYKTFMFPGSFWKRLYEPALRHMAGLGKVPDAPDPDVYDHRHAHCDLLVIGAGPAGLAAALTASRAGARVVMVDERHKIGGSLLASRDDVNAAPGSQWIDQTLAELSTQAHVSVLSRTTAFGYYDQNYVCALERRTGYMGQGATQVRQRIWHFRAKAVVLATGAHERPLVFSHNDRPGIMLASAVRTYVNQYAVLPGRTAAVFTNNDSAYYAARDFVAAGGKIAVIVDSRPEVSDICLDLATAMNAEVRAGHAIVGTSGRNRISRVAVSTLSGQGSAETINHYGCDLLMMSGGWNPAVHLFSQSGGKLEFDETRACFIPGVKRQKQFVAGALAGTFGLDDCLREGVEAARSALDRAGDGADVQFVTNSTEKLGAIQPLWLVPGAGVANKHFIDFQHDVTVADIGLASLEGMHSIEHLKRYTTTGMGTDQGKTSNVNALALLAATLGRNIAAVGTTTFRPPYTPVTFGAMAGRDVGDLSDPVRKTAIHGWHVAAGAVFEDVGQWKRPWYFPKAGERMEQAVLRECRAAREAVAMMDASTLGKIDIRGRDAGRFLNMVYTNAWLKLEVGRCRYGIMCKEDGMIFDDGVTMRLGPDHFYMTTTTGGAASVMEWLEELLQTEWPDMEVFLTSVTEQWSTIAVVGPKSRDVMRSLAPHDDFSPDAFPFMSFRNIRIGDVEARVARISFSGELAYEINVPCYEGLAMWQRIFEAGAPLGITPYGTETIHVLRAEKGFIIVGQDTDGSVTPYDAGMAWIVSDKKGDFIGKRSFSRPDMLRPDRKQLVGLLPDDRRLVLREGTQLLEDAKVTIPARMIGHVTSSYQSAALDRSFALALVKGGHDAKGKTIYASLKDGRTAPVRIVDPVFYDPEGVRRDG